MGNGRHVKICYTFSCDVLAALSWILLAVSKKGSIVCVCTKNGGWPGTMFSFWSIQSLRYASFIFSALWISTVSSNIGWGRASLQEKIFLREVTSFFCSILQFFYHFFWCAHTSTQVLHCTGTSWLLKHPIKWNLFLPGIPPLLQVHVSDGNDYFDILGSIRFKNDQVF